MQESLANLELEKNQIEDNFKQIESKVQRREMYVFGLEKQIDQLNDELEKAKQGVSNQASNEYFIRFKEAEQQIESLRGENWILKGQSNEKDQILYDYEAKINEIYNENQMLQMNFQELTLKMNTTGDTKKSRKSNRNKSVDNASRVGSTETTMTQNIRNTATSFYENFPLQMRQSTSKFNQNLPGLNEIFAMIGVKSMEEMIMAFKKLVKDKKVKILNILIMIVSSSA